MTDYTEVTSEVAFWREDRLFQPWTVHDRRLHHTVKRYWHFSTREAAEAYARKIAAKPARRSCDAS